MTPWNLNESFNLLVLTTESSDITTLKGSQSWTERDWSWFKVRTSCVGSLTGSAGTGVGFNSVSEETEILSGKRVRLTALSTRLLAAAST
jgi:hypothetical protein